MFYLTTYSQHILFTIIWRRAYGKGPLKVASKRGNPISIKGSFIYTIPHTG